MRKIKIEIDIHSGSDFQQSFILKYFFDALKTIKEFFEGKNKNNKIFFVVRSGEKDLD